MAKLTRQLQERVIGAHKENEDWWRLVFDTEAKRLYVEQEWSHTDAWPAARSQNGSGGLGSRGRGLYGINGVVESRHLESLHHDPVTGGKTFSLTSGL